MAFEMAFDDVEIVGINTERSERSSEEGSDLIDLYVELDPSPPTGWGRHFSEVWDGKAYSARKRSARAVGNHIIITCEPERFENAHLPALREAVMETNRRYRESAEAARREMEEEQRKRKEAQDRIDRLDEELDL